MPYYASLVLLTCLLLFPSEHLDAQSPAQDLLRQSIQYHDPNSLWAKSKVELHLVETRPGSPDRTSDLIINNKNGRFTLNQIREQHHLYFHVRDNKTKIRFDDKVPRDSMIINKYALKPARALVIRNFYTYLYGLPMRLMLDGAIIDENIFSTEFEGEPVRGIRVTYPTDIGKDIWYFYFHPETSQLKGYRFYHDESKNDGEYIVLKNEVRVGPFLLPGERNWYTNSENEFLGSDRIIERN